jgi:hypothetical protein
MLFYSKWQIIRTQGEVNNSADSEIEIFDTSFLKKQIYILVKYAFFPLKMYLLKQVLLKSCMWSTGGRADRKIFPCVLVATFLCSYAWPGQFQSRGRNHQ